MKEFEWLYSIIEFLPESQKKKAYKELYETRTKLIIALINQTSKNDPEKCWKSKFDFEGKECLDGWINIGINNFSISITDDYWNILKCREIKKAIDLGNNVDELMYI